MSKRHGIGALVIVAVLAWIVGVTTGVALAPSTTPYALTTLYGKGADPVGVTSGINGDIICDPNHAIAVQVTPSTRGIRSLDDEGQQVSVVAWPNEQRQIVLELKRIRDDSGSVWSYRAIIARNDNGVVGLGGLETIGVFSQTVRIVIAIGNDRPVPTSLTLCRLDGVG